jgi:hypothetical protein
MKLACIMNNDQIERPIQPLGSALISVRDYDVLLGRGRLYESHPGNLYFQRTVEMMALQVLVQSASFQSMSIMSIHLFHNVEPLILFVLPRCRTNLRKR